MGFRVRALDRGNYKVHCPRKKARAIVVVKATRPPRILVVARKKKLL